MCVCRSHFHRSTNVPSSPASTWTWLIRSLQPVRLFQFAPPSCAKEPNIQFWTPENGFCQGIWFDFKEELWLITILLFMIWYSNTFDTGWNSLIGCGADDFIFSGTLIVRFNDSVQLDYKTMTKWRADGPWQDLLSRFYFNSTPGARIEPNGSWIFNQYKLTLRKSCALTDSLRVSGFHGPEVNPSDRF